METITDSHTGLTSKICRVYRVNDGENRLFVGRDRKVWLAYGDEPTEFSYVGDIPADEPITRSSACQAANCS